MSREAANGSWPCVDGALPFQSCTPEIANELTGDFNDSNSLDKGQVSQATRDQCCSEVRMGRGISTPRAPTQLWGQTWGLPIVFPREDPTGPAPKEPKPPHICHQLWVREEDTLHLRGTGRE